MRRVVIVGGGAAGYAAAQLLAQALAWRHEASLTLVSNRPVYPVRPLLSEVAAGTLSPSLVLAELARLVDYGPIEVVTERIETLELSERIVRTDRRQIPFDFLLLAPEPPPSRPDDWSDDVFELRTDLDAAALRNRLRLLWQNRPERPPHVVIVGGGPVGVDLAAHLAAPDPESRPPDSSRTADCRVTLVEKAGRLVRDFPTEFADYAHEVLDSLGVTCRWSTALGPNGLVLDSGDELEADLTVWTGGEAWPAICEPLLGNLGTRPLCDRFQRLDGYPDITIAGPAVAWSRAPEQPRTLAAEVTGGRTAAKNLLAAMVGRAPEPGRFNPPLTALPVGRGKAIALVMGTILRGRAAWALYRGELAWQMPRLSSSLGLLGAWAAETVRDARGAGLLDLGRYGSKQQRKPIS